MKGFQKLALVAAIAAAPFAAQAEMTAMDDSLLSEMTGQSGVTLDINLDMSIAEIRYTDEDGASDLAGNTGYITLDTIVINGDQGNGTQAIIKGVTIDVEGDTTAIGGTSGGIVIGLGEIGGESTANQNSDLLAVATADYWTGVNVSANIGINGVSAGSIAVKNFTNFVPNALAYEAVSKFGYTLGTDLQLTNDDASSTNLLAFGAANAGITALVVDTDGLATVSQSEWDTAADLYIADNATNGFATALAAGNHVDASITVRAGGSDGQGLTIDAVAGFVIEELTYTDDGSSMGLHNFVMFDTDDTTGKITGFKVTGLTIDVVASGNAVDGWTPTNSNATAALKIAGLVTEGTIAMGDIFVGDHHTGSLGAVAIKDIDMSNTQIYVYGH